MIDKSAREMIRRLMYDYMKCGSKYLAVPLPT